MYEAAHDAYASFHQCAQTVVYDALQPSGNRSIFPAIMSPGAWAARWLMGIVAGSICREGADVTPGGS